MRPRVPLLAGLLLLHGCLFAPEEEGTAILPSENVNVVPDDEPFDPSKAVEDTARGKVEESVSERPPAKTEAVATEVEAEAREENAQQTVERINESGGDDDEAKAAAASNPLQEDPGSGERWTVTLLDWALELLLILVLALALSGSSWLALRLLRGAGRRRSPSEG